jgi:hypothetical protein
MSSMTYLILRTNRKRLLQSSLNFLKFSFFLFLGISRVFAFTHQDYVVINKGGREGLAESNGTELIPPVYDKIGWSDGELKVQKGVVGYLLNGKWGLITDKNKLISPPLYYRITPFDDEHFIASLKGAFSNKLFKGLLNNEGDVVINLNYFDIEVLADGYQVTSYSNGEITKGFINDQYNLQLSPIFRELEHFNGVIAAQDKNYKWSFSRINSSAQSKKYDNFEFNNHGIEVELNGKHGWLDILTLEERIPVRFKYIKVDSSFVTGTNFSSWEIQTLNLDSGFIAEGDSLQLSGEIFLTYLNGNQELLINGKDLFQGRPTELMLARSGYLITKDLPTNKWNLLTTRGEKVIINQDSIHYDGQYFFALDENKWNVYNRFGRKLSLRGYDQIKNSLLNMVPVSRGQHWGLLDFRGQHQLGIKYDQIGQAIFENNVEANYLGDWGVIDLFGKWVIPPDYDTLIQTNNQVIARRGNAFFLIHENNTRLFSSPDPIRYDSGMTYVSLGDTLFGVLDNNGHYLLEPEFNEVFKNGPLFFGRKNDYLWSKNEAGKWVLDTADRVQEIYEFSEDFYRILKDNKFGFVDTDGKLRIANRYDSARKFTESMAPFQLRGKWGFINKQEVLAVQPIFEWVGEFDRGICVVRLNGQYGLIDKNGDWVLRPGYKNIEHKKGSGYILHGLNDKIGAANSEGQIRITEQYDQIVEVSNGLLVVSWNGKMGIMDQEGYIRVPFQFDLIDIQGDYFVMRKLTDN